MSRILQSAVPLLVLTVSFCRLGAASATTPVPRGDKNSQIGHEQLVEKAKQDHIDIYFEGDSITRRWGATDYPDFLANWRKNFYGWNAGDFGWGGDTTQNILWRLENHEFDGLHPKVIVLLAGTNNVGRHVPSPEKIDDIAAGIKKVIDTLQQKAPDATLVLTAIFPRNDSMAVNPAIHQINEKIAKFADGKRIRFVDINDKLADKNDVLYKGMTMDGLHPTVVGYQIWADALKPIFTEVLGPPAATDQAPPPTGDPSAQHHSKTS